MIVKYTPYEYCNMHGSSNNIFFVDVIQATAAVFPRDRIVTSMALVQAGRPQTVQTPANGYAKIVAV
jgi:hypothetical protein